MVPAVAGSVSKITLRANGATCTFTKIRVGDVVGVAGRPALGVGVKQIGGMHAKLVPISRARVPVSTTCLRTRRR